MGGAVDPSLDAGTERDVGALTPFARPLFASVWLANTLANFGGQVQGVGAAWLMTSLTRDPETVSLVTAATLAPIMAFALLAGAIADAVDRRLVLLAAQSVMLAASAALAWATANGTITPALLIMLTFVIGCGFAFNAPAWQATVRGLVPSNEVPAAISLNILGFNLSRTAGPALGGLVIAWGGARAAFTLNAFSYLPLIAVIAVWSRMGGVTSRPEREPLGAAIRAGLSHVRATRELRRIWMRVTLFGLALGALLALVPIVVRDLGAGPEGMGLVFGCSGIGAVGGALSSNALRERFGVERLLRGATLACAVAIGVVGLSGSLPLTAAAEIVTGFTTTLVYANLNVLVQSLAPERLLGRLLSIHQMGVFGGLAAGTWVWGPAAKGIGVGPALVAAAMAMGAMLLIARAMPLAEVEWRLAGDGG